MLRGHAGTSGSFPSELPYQPRNFRQVEKFTRPDYAHGLVSLPIEVPWGGIHCDDEVSADRQRAFQKPIVWFVANDAEFGQRMADTAAFDKFSDEIWLVTQHVSVLLKDGGTGPCFDEAAARELKDECGRVVLARKRGELQNAGIKNDSQGTAWRDVMPARVAYLPRTQPPPVRSGSCRGSRGARAPAPERA